MSAEKKNITIVGFGDSLTYGYGVLEDSVYTQQLKNVLPTLYPDFSFRIINSGVNGDTSQDGLSRLHSDVLSFLPDYVLILFGSNDSALNEGQYRTPYLFEQTMRQITATILQTGATPILMTPPSVVDTDFFPFTTNDRVAHYAEVVRKIAEGSHLVCIDLYSAFLSKQHTPTYEDLFQFDGIHLSKQGYRLLFDLVLHHLCAVINQEIHKK